MAFTPPNLEYSALAPMLIIFAAAIIGVIVEAFVSAKLRGPLQLAIALGATILSFSQVLSLRGTQTATAAMDSVIIDSPVLFMQGTILVFAFLGLLLIADHEQFAPQASAIPGSTEEASAIKVGKTQTEIYPLTLFAVGGMMLFPAASDLITLFIALEVLSLPLYLMAGLSRRRRLLSQEAALKYFLLGAYSSAFFLFGSAFLYGYAGTVSLEGIHNLISSGPGNDIFLLIGIASLSVGLLFKVGAVPFHAWTPDVYQGAPTAVTAFMAAATKVAAFGAVLRIFYTSISGAVWSWRPLITAIAIVTMLVGSLIAIAQRDVKRMLAYSSIAHAGFLLTGVLALNQSGITASLFYLASYGLTTLGAFALVSLVRDSAGEVTDLNRWVGLAKRSPLIATIFSLFLLSFAGIPLTAGFIGKFTIFSAAYENGNIGVVVVGVLSSAIAAFFYIRVIVMIFFADPESDSVSVVIPSKFTITVIWIAAIGTLLLGIYPTPILDAITPIFVR
ncbi:MAG: NADH-quinone oxidoreductase subunit NuoN [Actinomycetales bacterium]